MLEIQYGWRPLLQDIYEASRALAWHLGDPYKQRLRVTVRKEKDLLKVSTWPGKPLGTVPQTYAKNWCNSRATIRQQRWLTAIIAERPESIPAALGLLDPEVIAWEATPFSFVADWAIPIGDWLESRAYASRLKGTFITSDLFLNHHFPNEGSFVSGNPRAQRKIVSFTRVISNTLAVPMPAVKPLSKVASFQHCLNGLALMVSVVSGGKKSPTWTSPHHRL